MPKNTTGILRADKGHAAVFRIYYSKIEDVVEQCRCKKLKNDVTKSFENQSFNHKQECINIESKNLLRSSQN